MVLAWATGVIALHRIQGDLDLVRSSRPGIRVLFVGNSFTYKNSMPDMASRLAKAAPGGPSVFTARYAPPGATLADSVKSERLAESIARDPWDFVVLQEQSQLPSREDLREERTFPAAATFDQRIRASGARTILFETWGYQRGDSRGGPPGDTYEQMLYRLWEGYREMQKRLGAPVALVGNAWSEAITADPTVPLWAWDGRHPSRAGSYLAACVFFGLLTGRDPQGNRFMAGLEPALARSLQRAAQRTLQRR